MVDGGRWTHVAPLLLFLSPVRHAIAWTRAIIYTYARDKVQGI